VSNRSHGQRDRRAVTAVNGDPPPGVLPDSVESVTVIEALLFRRSTTSPADVPAFVLWDTLSLAPPSTLMPLARPP